MRVARRQFLSGRLSRMGVAAHAQDRSFLRAAILGSCLAQRAVTCRSCGDACDERAIRFVPRPGGTALPLFAFERCSGCGACVDVCPASALVLCAPDAGVAV